MLFRSDTTTYRVGYNATPTAGNIACQYLTTATGVVEDATNTDSVADGDEVCWIWDQNAGSNTMTTDEMWIQFTVADAYQHFAASATALSQGSATTWYHTLTRLNNAETTQAKAQHKANNSSTLKHLYGYVSAYSLVTGDLTVRTQVNGSNGNCVITFTATGQQSDVSNTDNVVDEDEVNYSAIAGGVAGTVTLRTLSLLATVTASGDTLWAQSVM